MISPPLAPYRQAAPVYASGNFRRRAAWHRWWRRICVCLVRFWHYGARPLRTRMIEKHRWARVAREYREEQEKKDGRWSREDD